jgi:hypothetical protein
MLAEPIELVGSLGYETLAAAHPAAAPRGESVVALVAGCCVREAHEVDPTPQCGESTSIAVLVIDELVHHDVAQPTDSVEGEGTERAQPNAARPCERG